MERKFGNMMFALFAVMLSIGPVFAIGGYVGPAATGENQAPVITGMGGPTSLSAGQTGTWSVSAYDPDGTYLSYSVNWGDNIGVAHQGQADSGSAATFQHTYSSAGTYTITFKVTDGAGASTQSTVTVSVQGTAPADQPPVINKFTGPSLLLPGSIGFWSMKVTDSDDTGASFIIAWGDGTSTPEARVLSGVNYDQSLSHTYTNAGTYTATLSVTDDHGTAVAAQATTTTVVASQANQPPVVTGVSGPSTLSVNEAGTWSVSAYDPDGTYLSYSVLWGDEQDARVPEQGYSQTATMQHTYSRAGTYTITFTVLDDQMAKTQSTLSVKVTGSGTSTSDVTATVGAIPTEVYQYDTVYVTGKISRGTDAASDSAQTYRVVLSLDNGNEIAKTVSAESGTVTSTGSVQTASQAREEEITLYPGESREVSAYFTATQLGTNFAKVMVYQKNDNGCKDVDVASGKASSRCRSYYELVASDSTKVYVKESGIPSPPEESVTIVLEKGWNQISVPARELAVSELAKVCDISTNVWYYNTATKQYEKATTLGGGHVGFWVKANAECKYTINETYITPAPYAFNLKSGWNMIGSPLSTTSISDFAGDCKITSGPWNYSPAASQYTYSEKLEPGKGYWVKVASDCTLGSANDMPPSAPSG